MARSPYIVPPWGDVNITLTLVRRSLYRPPLPTESVVQALPVPPPHFARPDRHGRCRHVAIIAKPWQGCILPGPLEVLTLRAERW